MSKDVKLFEYTAARQKFTTLLQQQKGLIFGSNMGGISWSLKQAYLRSLLQKMWLLWQQLHYPCWLNGIFSVKMNGWFIQLVLTYLSSLLFCSALVVLPFALESSFSIPYLLSTSAAVFWMNQCFHFSIITTAVIDKDVPTVLTGCKCDFLIAQVCKHRAFFCLFNEKWGKVDLFVQNKARRQDLFFKSKKKKLFSEVQF